MTVETFTLTLTPDGDADTVKRKGKDDPNIADENNTQIVILRDLSCEDVTYDHILLDGHHTVMANGLECESLYPGDVALSTLDGEARDEIFTLYPELAGMIDSFGPLCRRVLKPRELKVLQARI